MHGKNGEPRKETSQKAGTDSRPWNWRRTALERFPRSDVQMNVGGDRAGAQGGRRTRWKRELSPALTTTTASQEQLMPPHSAGDPKGLVGGGLTRAHQASTAGPGVLGASLTEASPEAQPAFLDSWRQSAFSSAGRQASLFKATPLLCTDQALALHSALR